MAANNISKFPQPEFLKLKIILSKLQGMKDVDHDFIPAFKFFTFRKAKVSDENGVFQTMLCI